MIDQAYEQGCNAALVELAEAFGGDVVEQLVKIAKDKDMSSREMAAMLGAGAAGAGAAGYGGWKGAPHLQDKLTGKAIGHLDKLQKKMQEKGKLSHKAMAEKLQSRSKWLGRGLKGVNKWTGAGAAGLAGAGLAGYAGKKLAE